MGRENQYLHSINKNNLISTLYIGNYIENSRDIPFLTIIDERDTNIISVYWNGKILSVSNPILQSGLDIEYMKTVGEIFPTNGYISVLL